MTKIKIGVAGAGVFGNFHSGKVKNDINSELIGIFDKNLEKAKEIAQNHNCQAFDNINEFLDSIDALVIAVPAIYHFEIAKKALEAGKHCLVEKPLAAKYEEAEELVKIAKEKNLILQAGHQERYIFKAMGLLEVTDTPKYIEAYRIGLPSPRGSDVSATLDLMVHDLDLAGLLMRSEVVDIKSKNLSGPEDKPDAIEAIISYANGAKAKFVASRAADERKRTTLIEYNNGKIFIDYISRDFEDTTGFNLNADFADRIKDPMQQAFSDFARAIKGEILVQISGEDGAKAVKTAQLIDKNCMNQTA